MNAENAGKALHAVRRKLEAIEPQSKRIEVIFKEASEIGKAHYELISKLRDAQLQLGTLIGKIRLEAECRHKEILETLFNDELAEEAKREQLRKKE